MVGMIANAGGVTFSGAAGVAAPGMPAGPDTVFRIFSMTKAIGSAAAMILIERGQLTMDATVESVLPEFADGLAAQFFVNHGAAFGDEIKGFTVDGSVGLDTLPGIGGDRDRKYYAITIKPQVFINLVPDHVILHRMFPMGPDLTVVECDWLYLPGVVDSGADLTASVELFDLVNRQDFEACERCQPAMSSRVYRDGGVLVPSEHHIALFHDWVKSRTT